MPKKTDDLREYVEAHLRAKAQGKKYYDRSRRLLKELREKFKLDVGAEVPLNDTGSRKAVLLDNFAGKEEVWGHGAVRRWEFEVIEP